MSFSSPETTTPPAGPEGPAKKQDFGDRVGSYFQNRYPVAGGLAGMLFGNGQQPAQAPLPGMLPQQPPPIDSELLGSGRSAQGQGNGLATLLKLFGI